MMKIETTLKFVPIVPFFDNEKGYDSELWITMSDVYFNIGKKAYKIESGFVTNLASIPSVLKPFINSAGKGTLAFIIHDFCYSKDNDISRKDADLKMLELCKRYKVKKRHCYEMYYGLRMFGRFNYDKENSRYETISKNVINWIVMSNK